MGRALVLDPRSLSEAFRRVGELVGFAVLPAVVALAVVGGSARSGTWLYDFHGDLYDAGRAILHGRNPYPVAALDHLAALARAGGHPDTTFAVPLYPAPALLAFTPLALLPYTSAAIVFLALSVASVLGALWLLGVRDWRCFGVAFLSWPVLHGLRLGALTPELMLGAAAAWRLRELPRAAAGAVAATAVAKLFLWPLALWLTLARRWRTLATAVLAAAAALAAGWAVLGFAGLVDYPRMVADLSAVEGGAGISVPAAGAALGLGRTAASAVSLGLGAGLLLLAAREARARGPEGERRLFGLVLVAALLASPLVWPHYLALLFVPIALLSPRFSALWLVPLAGWLAPVELTHGSLLRMAPHLGAVLVVGVALVRSRPEWGRPSAAALP